MSHRVVDFHHHVSSWHHPWSEAILSIVLVFLVLVAPVSADKRLQERSLYMQSTLPNATTNYTVSFTFMSPDPVGSVDMKFCIDPIPYMPCDVPPGLDVSNAQLTEQLGEQGFSILSKTENSIILTRTAISPTAAGPSSYTFSNIVNPSDTSKAFSIRLKTLGTNDGTGAQIDFGSVRGQVTNAIEIVTQVPPILIFCVAEQVEENCTDTNDNFFTDMGQLSPNDTLIAQSQMAVGTNASGGFVITANGPPPTAGNRIIDAANAATPSVQGQNQFGINLVANNEPSVGDDPEGLWANAVPAPDYSIPNVYKYNPGDVVASSPDVSLMKKFTVSYILNSDPNLRAGVYSTTITYIASGQF